MCSGFYPTVEVNYQSSVRVTDRRVFCLHLHALLSFPVPKQFNCPVETWVDLGALLQKQARTRFPQNKALNRNVILLKMSSLTMPVKQLEPCRGEK